MISETETTYTNKKGNIMVQKLEQFVSVTGTITVSWAVCYDYLEGPDECNRWDGIKEEAAKAAIKDHELNIEKRRQQVL